MATPLPANLRPDMREDFSRTGNAATLLARRALETDLLVRQAFEQFLSAAVPAGLSILAVGGYGRGELFPFSDIDLLLLFENDRLAESAKAPVGDFLQWLWDSGLRISQSVRTPAECLDVHDNNPELNISILDLRPLAGDPVLHATLASHLPGFLRGHKDELARHLARLTEGRYVKFGSTLFHLEPNIKEAPGGLRDYQLVRWLVQLRRAQTGLLPVLPELDGARDFLFQLRCRLHLMAGRDHNLLSFGAQETLAGEDGVSAAEWMRRYFRHARAIFRAARQELDLSAPHGNTMLGQFRDWRSRLSNSDFSVSRERVFLRSPGRLEREPEYALQLFEFIARHGFWLAPDSERRIVQAVPKLAEYFARPGLVWPRLAAILSLPYPTLALRAMYVTGVLTALFPEFADIECLAIRDFYHRYTVDEHSLVAIQSVENLARGKEPASSRYAELLSELDSPAVLLFALLFHDVGKGGKQPGHVAGSVEAAERALQRIGAPDDVRGQTLFLIRKHLEMSDILHSRDPEEPATAQILAAQVETVERLKALTVLTWADIGAVNPAAMTPWRADQLWRLYVAAYNTLTSALEDERIERPAAGPADQAEFLEGLPTRYLRTHSAAEVAAHYELSRLAGARGVATEIVRLNGVYRLTIATRDRALLFASIAGTLSSFGMNILKAEAFGNRRGAVLDTFTFADPLRTLDLNPGEVDRLRSVLERVVLGKQDVHRLLQNRPKAAPPSRGARINPRVAFDSVTSPGATLVEIIAEDRPGLLYDLAAAISSHGCNIEVVLIDTEAHRAIDVFYLTSGGRKLESTAQEVLKVDLLKACAGA